VPARHLRRPAEDLGNFAQDGNKAFVRSVEVPRNAEFPRSRTVARSVVLDIDQIKSMMFVYVDTIDIEGDF
jgi:hypothetical protein